MSSHAFLAACCRTSSAAPCSDVVSSPRLRRTRVSRLCKIRMAVTSTGPGLGWSGWTREYGTATTSVFGASSNGARSSEKSWCPDATAASTNDSKSWDVWSASTARQYMLFSWSSCSRTTTMTLPVAPSSCWPVASSSSSRDSTPRPTQGVTPGREPFSVLGASGERLTGQEQTCHAASWFARCRRKTRSRVFTNRCMRCTVPASSSTSSAALRGRSSGAERPQSPPQVRWANS